MNIIAAALVLVLGTATSITFWSTAIGLGRAADTLLDVFLGNGLLIRGALWVVGGLCGGI